MILKFKHLKYFMEDTPPMDVMNNVFGFDKMSKLKKILNFKKILNSIAELSKELSYVDFTKIRYTEYEDIVLPTKIDYISYQARLEIEQLFTILDKDNTKFIEVASTIIAISCYHIKYNKPYKDDSKLQQLRDDILNYPHTPMLGLYNTIKDGIVESNETWNNDFTKVNNLDPDFISAGGHMLDRFSTVGVIEFVCDRFNVSYHEAWNISYLAVQTSLLRQSTQDFIQNKMTKIKERRMKSIK